MTDLFPGWTWSIVIAAVAATAIKYGKLLFIAIRTFPRDLKLISRAARYAITLKLNYYTNQTAGSLFEKSVRRTPNKVCFYFEDETWTFTQVNELSNKIANYFSANGYKKGDVVALLMDNRPEYPCIWLGLSKIGVVTALINHNLRLQSLTHCVKVANARGLIYGKGFAEAVKENLDSGDFKDLSLFSFDEGNTPVISKAKVLKEEFKKQNVSSATPKPDAPIKFGDKLCYVYTSGTTGLPKAAVVKHHRLMMAAIGANMINGCRTDDIFLTPLPLYHMAGGMLAVGQAFIFSTPVVILRKFSASRFWNDCIRYNVTVTQYLGELCRFLLSQPEKPVDRQHSVRLVMGNGLRAEIWEEFQKRFNLKEIVEFYGATEGNCSLSNTANRVGAVGFLPRILLPILPMSLVKVDQYTGEPIRDEKTGLAIRCGPNEPGEIMATIQRGNPIRDFPGYTDSSSSSKKILRDIFKKGDSVFRAGDIMVMDELGYFYFRDRVGDTFRWKGENVSTMEVEAIVSSFCDLKDVAVYGVQIPGYDGRAGCAAIADVEGTLDLTKLAEGVVKSLPAYARPIFLRILEKNVDLTGTFKLRKVELQKEEVDINIIKDKMYVFSGGQYVLLTKELHEKIVTGKMRI